jgi:hypothetical protein
MLMVTWCVAWTCFTAALDQACSAANPRKTGSNASQPLQQAQQQPSQLSTPQLLLLQHLLLYLLLVPRLTLLQRLTAAAAAEAAAVSSCRVT